MSYHLTPIRMAITKNKGEEEEEEEEESAEEEGETDVDEDTGETSSCALLTDVKWCCHCGKQ